MLPVVLQASGHAEWLTEQICMNFREDSMVGQTLTLLEKGQGGSAAVHEEHGVGCPREQGTEGHTSGAGVLCKYEKAFSNAVEKAAIDHTWQCGGLGRQNSLAWEAGWASMAAHSAGWPLSGPLNPERAATQSPQWQHTGWLGLSQRRRAAAGCCRAARA